MATDTGTAVSAAERAAEVAKAVAPQYNDWDIGVIERAILAAEQAAYEAGVSAAAKVVQRQNAEHYQVGLGTGYATAIAQAVAVCRDRAATLEVELQEINADAAARQRFNARIGALRNIADAIADLTAAGPVGGVS